MKNFFLILIMLVVVTSMSAQHKVFIQTEFDPINTLHLSEVEGKGYNGTFSFNVRNDDTQVGVLIETFPNMDYIGFSTNVYKVFNLNSDWNVLMGPQFGGIFTNKTTYPTIGIDVKIEYHFDRMFVSLRGEGKKIWGNGTTTYEDSLLLGIGYRIF